jgi:hypothetical protein
MAAKRVGPRTSLGTYVMAAQFVDLLWPIFLLLGLEHVIVAPGATAVTPLDFISYPFSHSLLADLGWAFLFSGIYKLVRRDSTGAVLLWFVVMSHWLLDALTHRPDLLLYPGGTTYIGLGLWNSRFWTILIEGTLFLWGVRIYSHSMRPIDGIGKWAFRLYVGFLVLVYLTNIFGPPPPSEKAIGYLGLSMWLLVWWAAWIDRHRVFAHRVQPPPLPATPPEATFIP